MEHMSKLTKACLLVGALSLVGACASTKHLASNAASKLDAHYNPDIPHAVPDHWRAPGVDARRTGQPQRVNHPGVSEDVQATSLWSSSPQSLFGDRRASQYGDILTVVIEIDEEAEIRNSVTQSRQSDQGFSIGALFGLPENINRQLPGGATLSPAVEIDRTSNVSGDGNIRREEVVTLRLAARVVEVLPNGYLSLAGRQEIKVNNETRYLQMTGMARTEDITRMNTITYDKIAEARIFYGGQGQLSRAVRSGWGNTALSEIIPF